MSSSRPEKPRRVFLFTGHMVDRSDRAESRFPRQREGDVTERIHDALESAEAGADDLGLCGGAAGGDLIFAEACLERRLELDVLLPQTRSEFLAASVNPSGAGWKERFERIVGSPRVRTRVMPAGFLADEDLGLYARHARWLVAEALSRGPERLDVIALWDGRPGDGAGGTADVLELVARHTDRVRVIRPE